MNPISRRFFLKSSAIAVASVGFGSLGPSFLRSTALGQTTAQKRKKVLICIFQRGAADGLNIVVPHGDPDLYNLRGNFAIARPSSANNQAALELDGFFGLHPALAPLLPIFKEGHLAAIQACGSPDGTRSHFDAQDYMELGTPGDKKFADGWMSRAVLACPEDRAKLAKMSISPFRAVAMGCDNGLPMSLQGDVDALAISDLKSFGIGLKNLRGAQAMTPAAQTGVVNGFESIYTSAVGDVLHGAGTESFEAIAALNKLNPGSYVPEHNAVYPNGRFGESMKQIAQLVKADVGVEVAFSEIGGWDTHTQQAQRLTQQLREFGQALSAFYYDLGDRMSDVVVLTMSEFGRTVRPNGTNGTDHGHATCFFAMGGPVNGGKVLGKWPGLAPDLLYENRDLALTTDFRAVFGEIAEKHLGAQGLAKIFPGYTGTESDIRGVMRTA